MVVDANLPAPNHGLSYLGELVPSGTGGHTQQAYARPPFEQSDAGLPSKAFDARAERFECLGQQAERVVFDDLFNDEQGRQILRGKPKPW